VKARNLLKKVLEKLRQEVRFKNLNVKDVVDYLLMMMVFMV